MGIQVLAHTSFLGHTGYNNHSKNFFTNLNKYIPTRVRNFTYYNDLTYLTPEERSLLVEQKWQDPPYVIGTPFVREPNSTLVNIVLNESHHYFFYDKYEHPMIAYNVWESTKQIPEFFNRILEYDQFWCPTEFQRQCTIEQGYPENRIKLVPEGVNGNIFCPPKNPSSLIEFGIPRETFTFMIFGRWDFRKFTTEMIHAFCEEFKDDKNVLLIVSVDNQFASDDMKTTEERIAHYQFPTEKIKVVHFPSRPDYIKLLQHGNVLLSCSRAEGWNLPLMEALACGTPSIVSNWGGHLEFADGNSHLVDVPNELAPREVYMIGEDLDCGVWGEPDVDHLKYVMRNVYENYTDSKNLALKRSKYIRQLYTWDNAARKAEGYLQEFDKPQVVVPDDLQIKVNLGCGNDIKSGYINIDRYNNTGQVDMSADLGVLPFKDNTIDELYTSHVFEHIGLNEMYSVIEEWKRILKVGGKLILRLPNLEKEIKTWLETDDEKKWFEVGRIFGSQSHEGNTHLCGFNPGSLKSFLESFNFIVEKCDIGDSGFGEEIQCTAINKPELQLSEAIYVTHFVDGPFVEVLGDANDKSYYVADFLDLDHKSHVHQGILTVNTWSRPHQKFYTNWLVEIRKNGKMVYEHKFDLEGKNVLISFDTKSMGDTIAWFPQVEEFVRTYKCNVSLSTFWNKLFDETSNLKLIEPGTVVENIYASYMVGCYGNDHFKNKTNWRTIPLQQVCSDTLGIDYKELIPIIAIKPNLERPIETKYVTISEHSTFACKYWQRESGWQDVVNYLNGMGYQVMVISKEETKLKNVIKMIDKPIEETITNIYHSEFFMGVSAGPSWLAWALKVPVIMISGYSSEITEFSTNMERVINKDVCNSCFNDFSLDLIKGNWNWCPRLENTARQFECTKEISFDMVKEAIQKIERKLT